MKTGDKFPVTIAGETITEATVKEVNEKDNMATLMVPATLVTMSYRTHDELTPGDPADEAPEAVEGTEHVLLTDTVEVKPEPVNLATDQTGGATPPVQPETVPTPEQAPVVPSVPEEVEGAVEEKATE